MIPAAHRLGSRRGHLERLTVQVPDTRIVNVDLRPATDLLDLREDELDAGTVPLEDRGDLGHREVRLDHGVLEPELLEPVHVEAAAPGHRPPLELAILRAGDRADRHGAAYGRDVNLAATS